MNGSAIVQDSFSRSMARTMRDFSNFVLPVLRKMCPNMRFVEIEGRAEDEITRDFDVFAGIDVYRVWDQKGEMIGIASRIQRGKVWSSFTVRKSRETGTKTEYEKRKNAIEKGTLYPRLTIQAYITDTEVVIGVVHTKDLIEYIDKCNPPVRRTNADQIGKAEFFVCDWQKMKNSGYGVLIIREQIAGLKAA